VFSHHREQCCGSLTAQSSQGTPTTASFLPMTFTAGGASHVRGAIYVLRLLYVRYIGLPLQMSCEARGSAVRGPLSHLSKLSSEDGRMTEQPEPEPVLPLRSLKAASASQGGVSECLSTTIYSLGVCVCTCTRMLHILNPGLEMACAFPISDRIS